MIHRESLAEIEYFIDPNIHIEKEIDFNSKIMMVLEVIKKRYSIR